MFLNAYPERNLMELQIIRQKSLVPTFAIPSPKYGDRMNEEIKGNLVNVVKLRLK